MQTFTMLARRTLPTTQAVMPVLAFAASAALTLLVAGGIQAFHLWLGDPSLPGRGAQSRPSNYLQSVYILLAWASGFLLLTPLFTLGASAARLSARRRDDRLATLRLLGASTGRITLYTVAEALIYATVGFFIGFVLYLVLTIPFGMLHFLDTPLGAHNMILPAHLVFACYVGCLVIAALSSLFGLSKVTISPLGVRTRANAPKAGIVFLIAGLAVLVLGFIGAQLVLEILRASVSDGTFGTAMSVMFVLLILTLIVVFPLVLGMIAVDLLGGFTVWLYATIRVRIARTPAALLAWRAVLESPRAAWRQVSGVAMTTFIAAFMGPILGMINSASGVEEGSAESYLIGALGAAVRTQDVQAAIVAVILCILFAFFYTGGDPHPGPAHAE
ncbi:MAG: FtsX-like permease family protein, partial [Rothia aeria]